MYWSFRRLNKRCRYVCKVSDQDGHPQFTIRVVEHGLDDLILKEDTPKGMNHLHRL